MNKILKYTIVTFMLLQVVACGSMQEKHAKSNANQSIYHDFNDACHKTAEHLIKTFKLDANTALSTPSKAISTSFVALDSLNTSNFGLQASEQIAASLSGYGLITKEVRLRDALVINKQGEFILSRELNKLAKEHQADFVLLGTYSEAADVVYVTSKLVSITTGDVASAYNFTIQKDMNIASLIHGVKSQDLYPNENDEKSQGADGDFGSGGNNSLMDVIRDYDRKINESRKKKGTY